MVATLGFDDLVGLRMPVDLDVTGAAGIALLGWRSTGHLLQELRGYRRHDVMGAFAIGLHQGIKFFDEFEILFEFITGTQGIEMFFKPL